MLDERLNGPWWLLRLSYGLVPIIAGLDKFTNLLVDWKQYLNPMAERVLPFSGSTFMRLVGVIEIVVGILVLTKLTRVGAYIVSAWLLAIALNLITSGRYLDVAVRDLVMCFGAFVFARMTAVREGAAARSEAGAAWNLRTWVPDLLEPALRPLKRELLALSLAGGECLGVVP